jgi:hypothetical protein
MIFPIEATENQEVRGFSTAPRKGPRRRGLRKFFALFQQVWNKPFKVIPTPR